MQKNTTYNELLKSCDIGLSTVILERSILKNLNLEIQKQKKITYYG